VNNNSTVEIRSYNGVKTQLTHVNRLKALTECMVWWDNERSDLDDLRELKLRAERQGEENSEEIDSDNGEGNNKEEIEENNGGKDEDSEMEQEDDEVNFWDLESDKAITQNEESVTNSKKNECGAKYSQKNGANEGKRRSRRATSRPDWQKDFILDQ
jgi:hypothetical protein